MAHSRVRGMRLAAALVIVGASVACTILNPLGDYDRGGPTDAAVDTSSEDVVVLDAGPDCKPDPLLPCRCGTHDFCDDFDTDGEAPFARWRGLPLGNPIRKGDASIGLADGGESPPSSSLAYASSPSSTAYVMIATELDHDTLHEGGSFTGIRYSFVFRLDDLLTTDDAGRSVPCPDAEPTVIAGVVDVQQTVKPPGIGILVDRCDVSLGVTGDLFNAGGPGTYTATPLVQNASFSQLSENWLPIEIVVTDRDRAVALGYPSCQTLPPGPVTAASVQATPYRACLSLPTALADLSTWGKHPTIGIGGIMFGPGRVAVHHDNVVVDFIEQ